MKIIVVDDNMNIGDLLTEILIEKGYDATFFSKPTEAFRNMKTTKYDIALLDVRMPEMDGFALCKLIKGDDDTKATRVIFVSSHMGEDYVMRASSSGAEGYINKNLHPDEIIKQIVAIVNGTPMTQSSS